MQECTGKIERVTIIGFNNAKKMGKKITILTAYDYPTAIIMDKAGVDSILVGDSLGQVVLGYDDTLKVTMDDMLHHIKAVARGTKRAMVIGDMPFLSYHTGKYESVRNAGRMLAEGGCSAVKLEGGEAIIDDIKAIINAGIPVMGHLGFTPQSINLIGKPLAQGKTIETARKIMKDSLLLQDTGVFSIVLECVPYKLAAFISKRIEIPVIGIGSGAGCDGQVLVTPDMTGLFNESEKPKKHTRIYADIGFEIRKAVEMYISDVQEGIFPTEKNSFIVDDQIIEQMEKEYGS